MPPSDRRIPPSRSTGPEFLGILIAAVGGVLALGPGAGSRSPTLGVVLVGAGFVVVAIGIVKRFR